MGSRQYARPHRFVRDLTPARPDPRSILGPVEPKAPTSWDRDADLARIREAYFGYERDRRGRLWSTSQRGYARLLRDLDENLEQELRDAVLGLAAPMVIDLGSGSGELASVGAPLVDRWVGVELREEAVEVARRAFPDAEFLTASADAVPLESRSVDAVVARVLFSSLPSEALERAVANEVGRLLRPGGRLVWLDIRYSNPANPEVHGLGIDRMRDLFPGWRVHVRSIGLLPPIARRLGPMTRVAYPALAAVPTLRSHLVGHLRPPE